MSETYEEYLEKMLKTHRCIIPEEYWQKLQNACQGLPEQGETCGRGAEVTLGFDIEEKLDYMIDELVANANYAQNRYAQEYEAEIVTYVLDLERDYAELKREHEALQKLFSAQVDILQGRE